MSQQNSQLHRHHSASMQHSAAARRNSRQMAKRAVSNILMHMAGVGLTILARKAGSSRPKRNKQSTSSISTWHTEEMVQLDSDEG